MKDTLMNMERQTLNNEILDIVKTAINKFPEMRFGQILANLNIIQYKYNTYDENLIVLDPYNVNPKKMLDNIKKSSLYNKIK